MNFNTESFCPSVKVLVFHATTSAAQLFMCKILSGTVFGRNYKIDLTLNVLPNENFKADNIKLELMCCGFNNINSITISNDNPSIADADVFCYITNFPNPNILDLSAIEEDQLQGLYLLMKIATNLKAPFHLSKKNEDFVTKKKLEQLKPGEKVKKPIFLTDGLVALDILKSLSKEIPSDVFFCPTPLPAIAKSVLGDYLKASVDNKYLGATSLHCAMLFYWRSRLKGVTEWVACNDLNDLLVWAANDRVFNIEFLMPLLLGDDIGDKQPCTTKMISNERFKSLNLDHLCFGPSWMKKEFMEKVVTMASKNPYGDIYKASELSNTLRSIWKARSNENGIKVFGNIGVISDGSLETIKGLPYILPLIMSGDAWSVNQQFSEDPHLKLEIKRINKEVMKNHQVLIQFFKKYNQDKTIATPFLLEDVSDDSEYTY